MPGAGAVHHITLRRNRRLNRWPSFGPILLHELTFAFVLNDVLESPISFSGLSPADGRQPLPAEAFGKGLRVFRLGKAAIAGGVPDVGLPINYPLEPHGP
jgi:hypothetical protein